MPSNDFEPVGSTIGNVAALSTEYRHPQRTAHLPIIPLAPTHLASLGLTMVCDRRDVGRDHPPDRNQSSRTGKDQTEFPGTLKGTSPMLGCKMLGVRIQLQRSTQAAQDFRIPHRTAHKQGSGSIPGLQALPIGTSYNLSLMYPSSQKPGTDRTAGDAMSLSSLVRLANEAVAVRLHSRPRA